MLKKIVINLVNVDLIEHCFSVLMASIVASSPVASLSCLGEIASDSECCENIVFALHTTGVDKSVESGLLVHAFHLH